MRILTRKEQDELLKLVSACQIVLIHEHGMDMENFDSITSNLANISYIVDKKNGLSKIKNTVNNHVKDCIMEKWKEQGDIYVE